ncbi:extracellular solute-binding protein [Vagococcus lutrae]|uniref:extracellular solute-binding protein n=1 Tax=Vagococcus lutrae TaxID=81947 RepID=UPI002A7F72C6|nr:extracellular solute-binding protein [Vagococcus lutrae]MDY3706923.1 extracellular solute-binding protein [Vagococcus lutrae]
MKRKNWLFSGVLVGMSVLLMACGKDSGSETAKNLDEYKPYGKYDEPVEYTIGKFQRDMNEMAKGDSLENNAATRFVEEKSNIKAKIAWEVKDYSQKVALSISTGDIPDVLIVNQDMFKELAENDLIEDLSEVYEKAASDEVKKRMDSYKVDPFKSTTIDGKMLAIPTPYYYYEHNVTWIRKDWLEKSGESLPESKEDLYALAKKFVDEDMAGNGKTIGFTAVEEVAGNFGSTYDLAPLFNENNSFPRQWIDKDGKVEYGSVQPETKEVLGELREQYKNGVLDKQFAVRTKDERDGALAENVGIYFGPWWATYFELKEAIKKNPEADWIPVAAPLNKEGQFTTFTGTPVVRYLVVKKGYEHPEAIIRSLNLVTDFNFNMTDEVVKYKDENIGKNVNYPWYYAPLDFKLDYADSNKDIYEALQKAVDTNDYENVPASLLSRAQQVKDYQEKGTADPDAWAEAKGSIDGVRASVDPKTNFVDMAFYGKTKSMSTKWANLKKIEDETFLKIIMGEVELDEFDNFVEKWYATGGEDITKEVNEEVAKTK